MTNDSDDGRELAFEYAEDGRVLIVTGGQLEEWRRYGALMSLAALAGVTYRPGFFTPKSDDTQQHVFLYAERYLRDWHAKQAGAVDGAERETAATFAIVPVADIAELATTVQRAAFKVLEGWVPVDEQGRIDLAGHRKALAGHWEAAKLFGDRDAWRGVVLFGLRLADVGRVLELPTGPMLQADAILAAILEELGEEHGAGVMREAPVEAPDAPKWRRWEQTKSGPVLVGGMSMSVAKLLVLEAGWRRVLAERERERLAHGAISRRALRTLQHTVRVGPNAPELEGHSLVLEAGRRRGTLNVATVPSELVQGLRKERLDAAMRGAGLIATTGWNMLLHKGAVASSLRQFNGEQHPGLYRFAGYAGMADALGLASPKHRQALPDMLEFGELYRFDLGDGFEPAALWTHRVEKVGGEGQGRRLQWNIHPWVYGADVRDLPKGAEKELVFLSPQPAPMVAKVSPNLSAAQWALWWQFHNALVSRRAELLDTGAMTLDESWWQAVAEAAGWSAKQKLELLPKAIARYTSDLVDQLLEREPGKPWVFKPGRSLGGVAEGLKKQEARFRGNVAGGKARAKKREERMISGWRPPRAKGSKKSDK